MRNATKWTYGRCCILTLGSNLRICNRGLGQINNRRPMEVDADSTHNAADADPQVASDSQDAAAAAP